VLLSAKPGGRPRAVKLRAVLSGLVSNHIAQSRKPKCSSRKCLRFIDSAVVFSEKSRKSRAIRERWASRTRRGPGPAVLDWISIRSSLRTSAIRCLVERGAGQVLEVSLPPYKDGPQTSAPKAEDFAYDST
jgi:hypothetical protein